MRTMCWCGWQDPEAGYRERPLPAALRAMKHLNEEHPTEAVIVARRTIDMEQVRAFDALLDDIIASGDEDERLLATAIKTRRRYVALRREVRRDVPRGTNAPIA